MQTLQTPSPAGAASTVSVVSKSRKRRRGGVLVASTVLVTMGLALVPATQLFLLKAVPEDVLRHGNKLMMVSEKRRTSAAAPAIPHILYFTHKDNILETKDPLFIYDNVLHTIEEYRRLWQEPSAPVVFLDDDMCREKIQATDPRLLSWFNSEKLGMYKADICRVAALYLTGGYYFDIDIRVVEPVRLAYNVSFSSCKEATFHLNCQKKCEAKSVQAMKYRLGAYPFGANNLFQAYLATSPGHPALKEAFEIMVAHYEHKYKCHGGLGVSTLGDALAKVMPSLPHNSVRLLEETKNEKHMSVYYPRLPKQNGTGTGCFKIVHDPEEKRVYFYSRIPGVDKSCLSDTFNTTIQDKVVEF